MPLAHSVGNDETLNAECVLLVEGIDKEHRELYFGDGGKAWEENEDEEKNPSMMYIEFLLTMSKQRMMDLIHCQQNGETQQLQTWFDFNSASAYSDMDSSMRATQTILSNFFPTNIWHCCRRACFANIALNPKHVVDLHHLLNIHQKAEELHREIENSSKYVQIRRAGVGRSSIGFCSNSRIERESAQGITGRDISPKHAALFKFRDFVMEVLPYLYGRISAGNVPFHAPRKLCTSSICTLLGVSRSFLYNKSSLYFLQTSDVSEIQSVIDDAGIRQRQRRRNKNRSGFPPLDQLHLFKCGCDYPCFSEVPLQRLSAEYKNFCSIAQETKPRQKENKYLLNSMFCPITNTTIRTCNKALSALYTVSEVVIAEIRGQLDALCENPSENDRNLISKGTDVYRSHGAHPMNAYPKHLKDRIETHLDMVLRPDPSASIGESVCRVYSSEINTQEKLRNLLSNMLKEDGEYMELSSSTLQRRINDYLREKNCRLSFSQSDHNACPICKGLNCAILTFYYERKQIYSALDLAKKDTEIVTLDNQNFIKKLEVDLEDKMFQENEALRELKQHNLRDARIRKKIKQMIDFFRRKENELRREGLIRSHDSNWNVLKNHAILIHQDAMTKVDLPHFLTEASCDITRFRFDITAFVNAITGDTTVFSHEQGSGPKNSSSIIEEILLHFGLRSRGEEIYIIVSDNASVGKNWAVAVALPQYIVDQGIAKACLMVFLENNHGKWLCDQYFGQLQTRLKQCTTLGIDDLLEEAENVRTKMGEVRSFAINPLASIDFLCVFEELGYQVKPPKEFNFSRRNIHFSGACQPGYKALLPNDVMELIGESLPDYEGMVRISTEPTGMMSQSSLNFEDRFVDVPASKYAHLSTNRCLPRQTEGGIGDATIIPRCPLTVEKDKPFAPSGYGVVSSRTAQHVGYNGYNFRKLKACPELSSNSSKMVRKAWPIGLLRDASQNISNDGRNIERLKCAPANWIVRRPLSFYARQSGVVRARYPPQNMLNALYEQGPRAPTPWIFTSNYEEPPFPIMAGTAGEQAAKRLALRYSDARQSVHILQLLQEVFKDLRKPSESGVENGYWLHVRPTQPDVDGVQKYRNHIRLCRTRDIGYPAPPLTLRQAFKNDPAVMKQVSVLYASSLSGIGEAVSHQSNEKSRKARIAAQLFNEAEKLPGGLDRYNLLVEKDHERYSRELKTFRESVMRFDLANGLCVSIEGDK